MTVLSRGDRVRRSGRRPGWLLLTVLLVLAIAASTALVFTDRVELLRLAVILSLWAAALAAFVSAIYRRQSDADAAKARDLKMVYDLQLDREISARREYELNVETHLRRELAHELRSESNDEVAALRAELAALRTHLEILFDTDLTHRSAIETDRSFAQWVEDPAVSRPGRVTSSRVTVVAEEDTGPQTVETTESPIIDVPEEPLSTTPVAAEPIVRYESVDPGAHRRPSEAEETRVIPSVTDAVPPPQQQPQWTPPPPPAAPQWTPPPPVSPPMFTPQNGQASAPSEPERRGRHSSASDPAAPPAPPQPPARHRGIDEDTPADGGQSVAELLARLQHSGSAEGGRRRRRED